MRFILALVGLSALGFVLAFGQGVGGTAGFGGKAGFGGGPSVGGNAATRQASIAASPCLGASSCTAAMSVVSGNLLICGAAWGSTTNTMGVPTDSQLNTWTLLDSFGNNGANGSGSQWQSRATATNTDTVTFTESGSGSIAPVCVAVNDSSAGIDQHTGKFLNGAGTGANAQTTANVTTTLSNDYCWSWFVDIGANGGTTTAGTSPITYTRRDNQATFPSSGEDGTLAVAGTAAGNWTFSSGTSQAMIGLACVKSH